MSAAGPSVLFVCVKNGGKSQMAAWCAKPPATRSPSTPPAPHRARRSAQLLAEVSVDISSQISKAVTDDLIRAADLVVVLGREAQLPPVEGTRVVVWETAEPSERGIDGIERMHLVRDDITARTRALAAELTCSR